MSRRRRAEKRKVQPDAKYGDVAISKLINVVMVRGKKSLAERIVYGALSRIEKKNSIVLREKYNGSVIKFFYKALDNIKPSVEVSPRRFGGATYQVPTEVNATRAQILSFRWIRMAALKRPERTMKERLYGELNDAEQGRGASVKRREDTHKMAEANRTFAHYRF